MPETTATSPPAKGDVLDLVTAVQDATDVPTLLDALTDAACAQVGAKSAAVLQRGSGNALSVLHQTGTDLPPSLVIDDLRAALWSVVLGRTIARWRVPVDAPAPLQARQGWDSGMVLRMRSGRGAARLLALGGLDACSPADLATVQTMANIAGHALDALEIRGTRRHHLVLLQAVTEMAGDLGAAVSPTQLLDAMAHGLFALDGVCATRVWTIQPERDAPRIVATVGELAMTGLVERRLQSLLATTQTKSVRELLESEARTLPHGPLLSLFTLSSDPPRVLGIAHPDPLDELSKRVIGSLIAAARPALRKVEVVAERRNLLSSYTRALYPSARPAGLDVAIELHPNTSAPGTFGGDFYDWFDVTSPGGGASERPASVVALGDVVGKGIGAASAASMVVWSLRALAGKAATPHAVVEDLAVAVERELDADRFVTLVLLVIDQASWTVDVLLAGHPPPVLVGGGRGQVVEADPRPPLGVPAPAPAPRPVSVRLAPGEAVIVYTDGVTDAKRSDGERYGERRLTSRAAQLSAQPDSNAAALAAHLWDDVRAWSGGPPDDDCAILVARRPR